MARNLGLSRAGRCLGAMALAWACLSTPLRCEEPVVIAGHVARFDASGKLLPWIDWPTALQRELAYYRQAPQDHGYPRFVTETFLQEDWSPDPARRDTIPATQDGMGILSYLALHARADSQAQSALVIARAMGDYLLREDLTPATGSYPSFTRSTGTRGQFPLAAEAGSESDHPFEIEPDKGGIAGYALLQLFQASGERRYREQALHNARVLAAHQQHCDGARSTSLSTISMRVVAPATCTSGAVPEAGRRMRTPMSFTISWRQCKPFRIGVGWCPRRILLLRDGVADRVGAQLNS